jgi:hypothetical protein
MRKKALLPEERKMQIVNWFAIRIQHDNDTFATSHQIAKGLGLAPSQKLRNWLYEMVSAGVLHAVEINKNGRWKGWGFMLADGTFQRPKKETRQLKITYKGVSQLELFE